MSSAAARKCLRWVGSLAILVVALLFGGARPALAKGCRIALSAHGPFRGSVTDRGFGKGSRFAIQVDYQLSSLRFRPVLRGPWLRDCPESAEAVTIKPDVPTTDALMALFLAQTRKEAGVEAPGASPAPVSAAYFELSDAAGKLHVDLVGRGLTEIALTATWDAAQMVIPASLSVRLVVDFAVELAKERIKGGVGEDLDRYAMKKAAEVIKEKSLSGAAADAVAQAFIDAAERTDKVMREKLKPVILTATGKAGECELHFNATLNLLGGTYDLGFIKSCGDIDESQYLITQLVKSELSVEPGKGGKVQLRVVDRMAKMKPVTVTGGHTQGISAVTDAGEATVNAAGKLATVSFKVADIKADKKYPFTVHLNTPGGSPKPYKLDVDVLNVAPEVQNKKPVEVKEKPGRTMTLSGEIEVLDRNADDTNPGEIKSADVSTSGHPNGLETAFKKAGLDDVSCGGPKKGLYRCRIVWRKGRVEKPHPHEKFDAEVVVADDQKAEGRGKLRLEVEDVVPEVVSVTATPKDFLRNDEKKVGITAVLADDNGGDDIVDVVLDATEAGGPKLDSKAFDYEADPETRELPLTLKPERRFDHTDVEGFYDITLRAVDGDPPANEGNLKKTTIKVGNFPPQLCASGIVWGTPQGTSRSLCPGQPFTVGVCAADGEGDPFDVVAEGPGMSVQLDPSPGTNNWVGTLYAPMEPGTYTITVTMRETKTAKRKKTVEKIQIEVIDCSDTDISWTAKVSPSQVCPGDSFTVEPVVNLFRNEKTTVLHPKSELTFLQQRGETTDESPRASFHAPDAPGVHPVQIRADVLGKPVDYTVDVTVDPCAAATDDIIELVGFNLINLGDARDPTVQLMMVETQGSILRGAPPRVGSWDRFWRFLTPPAHASELPVILLKSRGLSSGEGFDVQVLSRGGGPLPALPPLDEGLVIEPLKKKAQERLQKEIEKLTKKLPEIPMEGKLNAYCLEFLRRPPRPGQLFQLAPEELQQKFAPMRRILDASRRLEKAGMLHPDSDPGQYLHSIRQWAMWSEERGFDQNGFAGAFLKRTKENVAGAGRSWTKEIEEAVRSLVPNRWRDIVRVMEEAKSGAPVLR